MNNSKPLSMRELSRSTVGPILLPFVCWILTEAAERGISRIYFLARDGYLLCKIAERIKLNLKIEIDCRYLYCSRQSLRMPTYHFIGEEAFDLLTVGGVCLTPSSVLKRAMLTEKEAERILRELNINEPDTVFTESQYSDFKARLCSNEYFRATVTERSEKAYTPTVEYLKKEGLFDSDTVAIADSGWTGSMQRSLRMLMEKEGYRGKIVGFYFGMYSPPKSCADGEYLTFYFNAKSGLWRRVFFNNNLFECMLCAPHPMTLGYRKEGKSVLPVFAAPPPDSMLRLTEEQIEGALQYTEDSLYRLTDREWQKSRGALIRKCRKTLKRITVYPTEQEARLLSGFMFSDDFAEGGEQPLAHGDMKKRLSSYCFFPRLFRKLTGRKNGSADGIFWTYGVIAFCHGIKKLWYRINVMAWDIARAIFKK